MFVHDLFNRKLINLDGMDYLSIESDLAKSTELLKYKMYRVTVTMHSGQQFSLRTSSKYEDAERLFNTISTHLANGTTTVLKI